MTNRLFLALACVLLAVRLPSLVQPMGADQGLYTYVGERILDGGFPYRDAWDQKPPAVHVAYAAMRAVWPYDSAVPGTDLLLAAVVAALVWQLGRTLSTCGVGQGAALIFLLLSNPSFARLAGVSVRAQCETFIGAAVTGAFLILARSRGRQGSVTWDLVPAGVLFGIAFAFKYNAATYLLAGLVALFLWKRLTLAACVALGTGFALPALVLASWLAGGGALADMYGATIQYNLQYSGETYSGALQAAIYLLTFPVRHARVDALWLVGGAGCAVLLVTSWHQRDRLMAVAWAAAACLSIAINGSRDLPQYFIQAGPVLALAAAWGASVVWTRRTIVNIAVTVLVVIGVWRVNEFPTLMNNTLHDARYMSATISRAEHLARYGDRLTRKYSALAIAELGDFMRLHSTPVDSVFVFGFSCGSYVAADRVSASRFFWSRPVIVGFQNGRPGYGVGGLLDDLNRTAPTIVALQIRDWAPDVADSQEFFMSTPELAEWLRRSYVRVEGPEGFDVWIKRGGA